MYYTTLTAKIQFSRLKELNKNTAGACITSGRVAELADLAASSGRARTRLRLANSKSHDNLARNKKFNKKIRYIGITNDLKSRLHEHNREHNKSAKLYKPFKLIYAEKFRDYKKARKREKFLKSGTGRKFLDETEDIADVAEPEYAYDSKSYESNLLWVRLPPSALGVGEWTRAARPPLAELKIIRE